LAKSENLYFSGRFAIPIKHRKGHGKKVINFYEKAVLWL